MLTNYIVCNYAVAGNFVGRSVYEQVVRFSFLLNSLEPQKQK